MAYPNTQITNPVTGQSIRFLRTAKDTNGQLLEMESTLLPGSKKPTLHYHPAQHEYFTFTEGSVTVCTGRETRVFHPGDTLHIPPGIRHAMWNEGAVTARMRWQVEPALDTEYLLETGIRLARDGRTDANGKPGFLSALILLRRFSAEYRPARPPYLLLKALFILLTPLARLRGVQPLAETHVD